MIPKSQVTRQLLDLGVQPGGVLLVHCAFSQVKPVEDGPEGLIAALRSALGPEGTLVMPSMTADDDHPFDPRATSCIGMGIVAQTFWQLPGVLRSDSPHAFAAAGPQAARITAPHPVDVPHGLDSPVGRVYELDGQVLLLGVDHTANTIHLGEYMRRARYRRKYVTLLKEGRLSSSITLRLITAARTSALSMAGWKAKGCSAARPVGRAEEGAGPIERCDPGGHGKIQQNETVFLHPFGVDEECDDARLSLSEE